MVPKRLKVLQILPALNSGGVERGSLEVSRYLVENGHTSMVMSAGGRLVGQLELEGGQHLTWPIGKKSLQTFRLIPRFRRFLTEQQIDILHCRSRLPAWIGFLAWRGMPPALRPRLVTTVHGFYSVGPYSAIMARGERVICVSDAIEAYVRANYPRTHPAAMRIIHRGIDPQQHHPAYQPTQAWLQDWHAQYPHLQNKRLLVMPGRLTRLKGHHDFIQLLSRLKNGIADIHGLIVGEADTTHSSYLAELKQAAASAGLKDDLTFTGHRHDLRDIFSISAMAVSLSAQPEAFGRTVLEALALGKPVVAYGHGGVSEIMQAMFPQGEVAIHNIEAAADRCAALLHQPVAPGPLPASFTMASMLQLTLAVYHELTTPLN